MLNSLAKAQETERGSSSRKCQLLASPLFRVHCNFYTLQW